jgi:PAS domain S-box-containing protein
MAGTGSLRGTPGTAAGRRETSTTAPLSERERAALRRARGTRLPLVVVLLCLALAVLLPQLTHRRVATLRDEVNLYADPARQRLTQVQLDLAHGAGQRRGYAVTHDSVLVRLFESTRLRRQDAERDLVRYVHELEGANAGRLSAYASRIQELDRKLDSIVVAGDPLSPAANLAGLRDIFQRVQATADTLASALDSATAVRHRMVTEIEVISTGLTVILVILGLGAASLVARLGTRYRNLALRLDEQQDRFRQIAENLSDVVWLSEPGFQRHLYVNRAYERIWGRSRESLEQHPESFLDSVHPDDRERVQRAFAALAHEGTDVEFRVVRPDGDVRWVWSRGFPVRNARGKAFRIAGIIEDITEHRRHAVERERLLDRERAARETAERREKELERVMESRVRLIRGFTHDVKNPLGAADGYLALMEEGTLGRVPPRQLETLTAVRRSIGHALELIGKLLDLARAEAGQLDVHEENVDVVSLVRDVAESFRAQAHAKDLALVVDEPRRAWTVRTDPALLRQVVANLVSNAVKYTPAGGRVCVELRVDGDGHRGNGDHERRVESRHHVQIVVADNGPGIPIDKLPLLFLEFTRFEPGAAEGSGIGLAISQRIARALGGRIAVDSRPNAGCTFKLDLPAPVPPAP